MSKYLVTTEVLRIRSGPGTSYAVIGTLLKNQIVPGDQINGDWVHVTSLDNKVGWSHRGFLELQADLPPTPSSTSYRVDGTTLNLRQGPGLNYAVLGSLTKGEIVQGLAVSTDGEWAQVRKTSGT